MGFPGSQELPLPCLFASAFRWLGVALCAFLLCPPEVRAAAKSPLLGATLIASLFMGAALWFALPRHLHPLALIGVGCAVYAISWAGIGRKLLKREVEGIT